MNSFEDPAAQQVSTTTADAKVKNSGIKTAQGVFEMYQKKDERIRLEDFIGVYNEEEIKKDMERVEYFKRSKDYDKPTAHGTVLENLFCQMAEKYEWFGADVKVVQLSEFDDMIASGAHCDAVLEIPVGDGDDVVRIGIDLTTAINYDNLNKKRNKCVDAIQSGKLFSVKYFKSKIDDTIGRISDMPVFFAGVNKENLEALCATVAKQENTGQNLLSKHEVQFMFLEQMLSQINRYVSIASSRHGFGSNITNNLEYYKRLIEWMKDDKKSLRPNNFDQRAMGDEVYKYIIKFI